MGVGAFLGCGSSSSNDTGGPDGDGGSRLLPDGTVGDSSSHGTGTGGDDDAGGDGDVADGGDTTFTDAAYAWKNVVIGGGGWITGLVRDPATGDLYARGDVGSLYRYDTTAGRWISLIDTTSYANDNEYGIESVALSPDYADSGTLYYAAGKYEYGAHDIFKSTDRGASWRAANLTQVPMLANGDDRWCGERLAVDPNNPERLYFGSPDGLLPDGEASAGGGLWQSINGSELVDGGASWTQESALPQGSTGEGLSFVVFDPDPTKTLSSPTRAKIVYAGVVDTSGSSGGVWQSTNGGESWTHLSGSSKISPCRAVFASNGDLYITYRYVSTSSPGGLAKLSKGATSLVDIDPPVSTNNVDAGYYAVAVDPGDPHRVYTTQSEGKIPFISTGPAIRSVFSLSTDGGAGWSTLGYTMGTIAITQQQYTMFAGPAAMVINASDATEAWVSDGFGVLHTNNLKDAIPTWSSFVTGIEEIVPDTLLAPKNSSTVLLSGASDVGGFVHTSLTTAPAMRLSAPDAAADTIEAISYAACASNPSVIVFTGHHYVDSSNEYAPFLGLSTDGGQSFTSIPTQGGASDLNGGGRIVISPNDCGTWVLQQFDGEVWKITGGLTTTQTWTPATADGGPQPWQVATLAGTVGDTRVDRLHNDTLYMQQLAVDEGTGIFYIATVSPPTVSGSQVTSSGAAFLYQSTDGVAWSLAAKVSFPTLSDADDAKDLINQHPEQHYTLRAVPGQSSNLWLAIRDVGLFHATVEADAGGDAGDALTLQPWQASSLTTSGLIAFGVAPSGSKTPSFFLHRADGSYRRSDDLGQTWNSIDDPKETADNDPDIMVADPNVWGRVFVGTQGSGIFVGGPSR
jgi:hypothetical protein